MKFYILLVKYKYLEIHPNLNLKVLYTLLMYF